MKKQWVVLVLALPCAVAFADQKRVYIAPDDHTDYFWSAGEATYRQAFLETLDYYLDLADTTATNPSEYQSRWNCDGSFWMWNYEKNRSSAEFQRLIDRIRDGHISVPLNALCVCLGGAPAEAVLRGMYYPGQIERQYDLRFRLAYTMENQTQPFGLTALWTGAGVKYSWKGICACDSQVSDAWDREHDIYRAVGPDGSSVLMKWNSMLVNNRGMGGYAEARNPSAVVDFVTLDAPSNGFLGRYPYDVIGCFGKGWDDIQTMTDEFVTTAQDKTDATRQVIVSNEQDFFEDFEQTHGSGLPSHACSFGNEWELYCATLAETSARVKRAVEKLRGAEALATLVSRFDPGFMTGRESARDLAWMDLGLFWEHNFGMAGFSSTDPRVAERINWQNRLADEIDTYVGTLYDDAATALAGRIAAAGGALRFYAFNPLSWPRTDYADVPYGDAGPWHVIDLSTGLEVPSQPVVINGEARARVLCEAVPPVGYKVYEIRPGAGQAFGIAADTTPTAGGMAIENSVYRLTVADRGAITSLIDKTRSNREFTQSIGGRFLNDLGASTGSVVAENAGPVSVTLTASGPDPLAHTVSVTLYRNADRIDIENRITENFNSTRTWSFGFNLTAPDVRHEEVGAIVRAKRLADGGHYSPRNARTDWLTLNHFADMTGSDDTGMTLSNSDCFFMRLGNSTVGSLDTSVPQLSVLAGGRVVGSYGIRDQGGADLFIQRFALRAHDAYDPLSAMKMSLEHQNPLICRFVTGTQPALPTTQYSLISISHPAVLLWTLKPADDGGVDGDVIIRLWNVSNALTNPIIQCPPLPILSAMKATHLETNETAEPVDAAGIAPLFAPQQMRTFRLALPPATQDPPPTITGWAVATTHGPAGKLFRPVTTGDVEPRTCGLTDLRATFDQPLDPATVTTSQITVVGAAGGNVSSQVSDASLDGTHRQMTITFAAALADQDAYTITIGSGVRSAVGLPLEGDRDINLATLQGDVTGDQLVDNGDMIAVNVLRGQPVTAANCIYDVNCTGVIDNNDLIAVRLRRGNQLP